MKSIVPLFFVALFAFARASVGANLITNGGFEDPAIPDAIAATSGFLFPAGDTGLTGWTVGGNDVYLLRNPAAANGVTFNAHGDSQALDLTGFGNSGANTISQTVSTVAGAMYTLSFWLGNATGSSAYLLPSSVSLAVTGLASQAFTNSSITLNGVNWAFQTVTFTASSSSTTITFTNTTPAADGYAGLDDIVLDGPAGAVPDGGSTLLMLSLALPGLVSLPRLFRVAQKR